MKEIRKIVKSSVAPNDKEVLWLDTLNKRVKMWDNQGWSDYSADDTIWDWIEEPENIGTEKLTDKAVTTDKLDDNAVTSDKIADNAVGTEHIQDNAITDDKLADNAVDTNAIQNDAVTNDKLADNAVDSASLQNNSVTTAKLVDGSVTAPKIADNAVTNDKLADNSVATINIIDRAVTADKLADNIINVVKKPGADDTSIATYEIRLNDGTTEDTGSLFGTIDIPKDQHLVDVKVSDMNATLDEDGTILDGVPAGTTALVLSYYLQDGTYKIAKLDYQKFIEETEFGDGLQVVNHVVQILLNNDTETQKYLKVSSTGIGISGVDKAISDAISESESTINHNIDTLASRVSITETDIDNLESKTDATNDDVTALTERVTTAEENISESLKVSNNNLIKNSGTALTSDENDGIFQQLSRGLKLLYYHDGSGTTEEGSDATHCYILFGKLTDTFSINSVLFMQRNNAFGYPQQCSIFLTAARSYNTDKGGVIGSYHIINTSQWDDDNFLNLSIEVVTYNNEEYLACHLPHTGEYKWLYGVTQPSNWTIDVIYSTELPVVRVISDEDNMITTLPNATTEQDGLLSKEDKANIDSIAYKNYTITETKDLDKNTYYPIVLNSGDMQIDCLIYSQSKTSVESPNLNLIDFKVSSKASYDVQNNLVILTNWNWDNNEICIGSIGLNQAYRPRCIVFVSGGTNYFLKTNATPTLYTETYTETSADGSSWSVSPGTSITGGENTNVDFYWKNDDTRATNDNIVAKLKDIPDISESLKIENNNLVRTDSTALTTTEKKGIFKQLSNKLELLYSGNIADQWEGEHSSENPIYQYLLLGRSIESFDITGLIFTGRTTWNNMYSSGELVWFHAGCGTASDNVGVFTGSFHSEALNNKSSTGTYLTKIVTVTYNNETWLALYLAPTMSKNIWIYGTVETPNETSSRHWTNNIQIIKCDNDYTLPEVSTIADKDNIFNIIGNATTTEDGLMSSEDKVALDNSKIYVTGDPTIISTNYTSQQIDDFLGGADNFITAMQQKRMIVFDVEDEPTVYYGRYAYKKVNLDIYDDNIDISLEWLTPNEYIIHHLLLRKTNDSWEVIRSAQTEINTKIPFLISDSCVNAEDGTDVTDLVALDNTANGIEDFIQYCKGYNNFILVADNGSSLYQTIPQHSELSENGKGEFIFIPYKTDTTLPFFNKVKKLVIERDDNANPVKVTAYDMQMPWDNYTTGCNTITTIESVPTSKKLVVANIDTSEVLSLAGDIPAGQELHIIVNNTSDGTITLTMPYDSYIQAVTNSLIVAANTIDEEPQDFEMV